jgi:UDP-N-acetylmuramoyl-tripeptide--D-alanyl-D-alanine ligase
MKISLKRLCQWLDITKEITNADCCSISIDSRHMDPGALFVAVQGENFDGHDFIEQAASKGAVAAIVSRHIETALPTLLVKDTRAALGLIAKKWREQWSLPVIAVTGSCGKTSTKSLIASILGCAGRSIATEGTLNNDIGVPLTVLRLAENQQYAVFELGANHEGEIMYLADIAKPTVSIITNAGAAHLEGFGSIEGVVRAKSEIYQALDSSGIAVLNSDDAHADFWRTVIDGRKTLTFSMYRDADFYARDIDLDAQGHPHFTMVTPQGELSITLPLVGKHHVANALAAAAACFAVNISLETIQKGLESSEPINKRLVVQKSSHGATIIDDTYNANPLSMYAALEVLTHYAGEKIFVLGDMGELGAVIEESHRDVGYKAKQLGVHRLYAVGQFSRFTAEAFGHDGQYFRNKQDLVVAIKKILNSNMTVLIKGSRSAKMEEVVAALMEN